MVFHTRFCFPSKIDFLDVTNGNGLFMLVISMSSEKKRTKTSNTQAFPAERLMKGIKNIIQNNTICNNFLNRSFHSKNILLIKLTPKFIMKRIRPVKICLSCSLTSLNPVEFYWHGYLSIFTDLNKSQNIDAGFFTQAYVFFISDFKSGKA